MTETARNVRTVVSFDASTLLRKYKRKPNPEIIAAYIAIKATPAWSVRPLINPFSEILIITETIKIMNRIKAIVIPVKEQKSELQVPPLDANTAEGKSNNISKKNSIYHFLYFIKDIEASSDIEKKPNAQIRCAVGVTWIFLVRPAWA